MVCHAFVGPNGGLRAIARSSYQPAGSPGVGSWWIISVTKPDVRPVVYPCSRAESVRVASTARRNEDMTMIAPAPIGYERSPVPGTTFDDLDHEALRELFRRRTPNMVDNTSVEHLSLRFGLVAQSGSRITPTIAGLYLFGRFSQLLRPDWGVTAVRVDGRVLTDPILARADLEGGLAALHRQALEFVREHTQQVPDALQPSQSTGEYAEVAVREAIANALVHRDLRIPGKIAVRMFDGRIEIWNPGGMSAAVLLEEQAQHGGVSLPRNPLIASIARSLGLVEQLGRGLPLIRRAIGETSRSSVQVVLTQTDVKVVIPSLLQVPPHVRNEN